MSIDAEKYDLAILAGLRRALSARAVDVVEFEYSRGAHLVPGAPGGETGWTLNHSLALLHADGYRCWWQSGWQQRGCLYPASGACWRDDFECYLGKQLRHSSLCVDSGNLVCAVGHAGTLLHRLAAECAPRRLPP